MVYVCNKNKFYSLQGKERRRMKRNQIFEIVKENNIYYLERMVNKRSTKVNHHKYRQQHHHHRQYPQNTLNG